ncbi:hypothetical protein [Geodermatophilus sp. DSM 45219]|uniref:hypothetical protein n=1 Tax=Geodermatophilus sp. DSM 45219 TaxID=1881103 RepID=UPI00088336EE|nr:hypothetical protein [Geodermatophilus sp. DSM 45219]SDN78823.1 hypothetical protein SAMN05428965_1627 [Geodermatophilus sp. DSM 45219]
MPVSTFVYGLGLRQLVSGGINFPGDTIKAALLTSAYTPNQDTHEFFSAVSAAQVTGTGYTAGGVTLTSKTNNYDAATNTVTLDAADPAWANSTITAHYLVFYKDTGTAGTSPLLALVDFGADVSSTGAAFTYQLPATGLAQLTAA